MKLIPVRLTGTHEGLVIWHTPAEYEALWKGVDRQAALVLGREDVSPDGERSA